MEKIENYTILEEFLSNFFDVDIWVASSHNRIIVYYDPQFDDGSRSEFLEDVLTNIEVDPKYYFKVKNIPEKNSMLATYTKTHSEILDKIDVLEKEYQYLSKCYWNIYHMTKNYDEKITEKMRLLRLRIEELKWTIGKY